MTIPLSEGESLITIPEEVRTQMNTDAKLSYQLVQAITSGIMPRELTLMKTGKLNHSRWLTTGEGFLVLWTRKHGFMDNLLIRLEQIVNFLVKVYFRIFFEIKVKHSWVQGRYHILSELKFMQGQPIEVKDITMPYVRTGAWFAHSEALLLSMLASSDPEL